MSIHKQTTIPDLYELFKSSTGVTTDSRKVHIGSIYISLKGDNFDGNAYAEKAIENGAAYAVVDNEKFVTSPKHLLVPDGLIALQQLATFHRRQFFIPVIAITGSNGKTTTKELVASVLGRSYNIHYTHGNLNNHIGVPLTLLGMETNIDIAVIEMGANHIGEIKTLCEIAEPSHGIITNIGQAHLEGFGGLEGVKKGKSELYHWLEKNRGIAFINKNEKFLEELAGKILRKVFYTKSDAPDPKIAPHEILLLATKPFLKVGYLVKEESFEAQSNLIGAYNFNNLMTAISLGKYFKVPGLNIKEGIENYLPSNNRSQIVIRGTNQIILDAYNANPTSMQNAIEHLATIESEKKIAIVGDMLELGTSSKEAHQEIVDILENGNMDQVVIVGKEFKETNHTNCLHFDNFQACKTWFDQQSFGETTILIKGSRGIQLEKIL